MEATNPGFNLNTFESHWDALDDESKTHLIVQAGSLDPSLGILPVLEGLTSFQFNVRSLARKSLDELSGAIQELLNHPDDSKKFMEGQRSAVRVSARIYQQIRSEISFSEMNLFLNNLLVLGDKGAFFAFKALYQGRVTMDVMNKVIQDAQEADRLAFVDQYLQTTPAIRLGFAPLFKKILTTIKKREPVIDFYASLFDRKRDADPFLNNIAPSLRDPEKIIEMEIQSQSPANRIRGLKALSMLKARIPSKLILEVMADEEVKKVRLAVYSLIENSSMGLYPELFKPLFRLFSNCDTDEAVNIFKALVVTGKIPLHELMGLVRKTNPNILPNIHIEISSLSRISFFVIQDIALNKKKYLGENFDINLACIFGMIKKRPERVVRILKSHDAMDKTGLKMDAAGFVKKTTQLLIKEKQSIEEQFSLMARKVKQVQPEKTKKFFQSVIKDPAQKKMEALKTNASNQSIDFSASHIRDENFSGLRLSASPVFFVETIFQNTDFSQAQVEKACFKKAVFYNVNMDGAIFDSIGFDNAVFINVDARKAVFKNCSFQGAAFFNCNFNQANLSNGIFIDAIISKTSFGHTNLTCASFSYARISGVSFATAYLNMGDFSGVKARFSRFPSYTRSVIRTQGIDYNFRDFQLSFNDMPDIDKSVVSEINMLIFCEFIHYGESKFLNQNKLSLLTAYDIFKPAQADFFQLLPLLIHENIGFSDMPPVAADTPCGIADYLPSWETMNVGEKYMGRKKVKQRRAFSPYIQGVFSMGSVGSLAQTEESDIDYWICINEQIMDREGLALLRKKLDALEKTAWDKFKIRVTFFVVDILKARNNDFGGSSQESSGTAQSRLLKEEFYRTMIHVAGKLPLWAVLPTTISVNYYNLILDRISKMTKSHRYIDLGDIHAIPANEYFGASIWQMFKWLKSPFKSVIKMALLEKYIQAYGTETLLCNQYKNEWMNSGTHLKAAQNDSYIILLNNLIAFYLKSVDEKSVNLLLTCFFLKLGISKQAEIDQTVFGLRKILLDQSLSEWGWTTQMVFEIGRFKIWPYSAIHRLSITIERYMVSKYTQLKSRFNTQSGGGLMISNQDRIVLERKVDVVFQDKPHKIKKLLLVSRGDRHFSRLLLKYLPRAGAPGRWELMHKIPRHQQQTEETIITADTIEKIGAWLINNSLYTDSTFLGLVPNPTSVSHEDIEKLYRSMYEFLIPEMKKTIHFTALRKEPVITRLFVSINFYAGRHQTQITDYTAVYLNSWGEMYLRGSRPGINMANQEELEELLLVGLSLKSFPEHTGFYTSRGMQRV